MQEPEPGSADLPGSAPAAGEADVAATDQAPSMLPSSTKLFLGGLSWQTTEETLHNYFGRFGAIDDAVVMRDRMSNAPRGFGFITFKDADSAAAAVAAGPHLIQDRMIDCKPSVPQGLQSSLPSRSRKVFVGGLGADTTEAGLRAYFETFGSISEAQVMQDYNTGRSRGFGFVTFEEEGALERVFEAGVMHVLSGKQVEVKPATPKGQQPLPSSMGMQGQQQLGGPTPYYSMVGPGTASGMRYPPPHGPRGQAMGYSMTPLPHYSGLGRPGAGPVAMYPGAMQGYEHHTQTQAVQPLHQQYHPQQQQQQYQPQQLQQPMGMGMHGPMGAYGMPMQGYVYAGPVEMVPGSYPSPLYPGAYQPLPSMMPAYSLTSYPSLPPPVMYPGLVQGPAQAPSPNLGSGPGPGPSPVQASPAYLSPAAGSMGAQGGGAWGMRTPPSGQPPSHHLLLPYQQQHMMAPLGSSPQPMPGSSLPTQASGPGTSILPGSHSSSPGPHTSFLTPRGPMSHLQQVQSPGGLAEAQGGQQGETTMVAGAASAGEVAAAGVGATAAELGSSPSSQPSQPPSSHVSSPPAVTHRRSSQGMPGAGPHLPFPGPPPGAGGGSFVPHATPIQLPGSGSGSGGGSGGGAGSGSGSGSATLSRLAGSARFSSGVPQGVGSAGSVGGAGQQLAWQLAEPPPTFLNQAQQQQQQPYQQPYQQPLPYQQQPYQQQPQQQQQQQQLLYHQQQQQQLVPGRGLRVRPLMLPGAGLGPAGSRTLPTAVPVTRGVGLQGLQEGQGSAGGLGATYPHQPHASQQYPHQHSAMQAPMQVPMQAPMRPPVFMSPQTSYQYPGPRSTQEHQQYLLQQQEQEQPQQQAGQQPHALRPLQRPPAQQQQQQQ